MFPGAGFVHVANRDFSLPIKIGPNISIILLHADQDSVRLGVKVPDDPGALACLCDPPLREYVDRWRKRSELLDIKTAV
jgi:hypothetical protein